MKLTITGTIFGTSGYDSHTKGLFNSISKYVYDIKLDVPLVQGWEQYCNHDELISIKREQRTPDYTICIASPPQWRLHMNKGKFIGYCIWEGTKIPDYWLNYLNDDRVHQIWVSSQHNKDAIVNTLFPDKCPECNEWWLTDERGTCHNCLHFIDDTLLDKIKIIPHGYDPKQFYSQQENDNIGDIVKKGLPILTDDGESPVDNPLITYISNKGWRGTSWDRGGVQYTIRAFCNEFTKKDNVRLLLKVNPAYINYEQLRIALNNMNLPEDRPEIILHCQNLSIADINTLYNSADCYICSTRAEAFDLGSLEAMATGLPIIVTNYGGQIEHMNNECSYPINYKLEKVSEDIMYENCEWATPDIKHLQQIMRNVYNNREELKEKGKCAKIKAEEFTWDETAKNILRILK